MAVAASNMFEEPQSVDDDVRESVLAQLEHIREHKLFRDTTRMKRFLSYVVDEALAGRADRLKGYTIGVEVFDRPDDFDPQADTIVRVQAGQLRRRLDLYYSEDGKRDTVRFIIPKGQYAPIFEMRRGLLGSGDNHKGFESLGDENSVSSETVATHNKTRPGVAVFTFDDLNVGTSRDFFAEGLTAEIVNALVQFRYLRIVSRLPTLSGRNEHIDIKSFAKAYDVQFILSGSVRRVDDVFRVSVNLISTETGEHIFTKIFDKQYSASNIFDLQEEIASYTAAKIAAPFGVVNRFNRRTNLARAENMPAYEALLKFYDVKLSPTMERGVALLNEFAAITEQQPQYSSAWAIRAILTVVLSTQTISSVNMTEKLEVALDYAKRATIVDPDNALGFMSLYMVHYHLGQFEDAEKMAQKSMALNPNDYSMLAYYGITNAFKGNIGRAVSYQNAAMRLIDRPPIWFYMGGLVLALRERRYDDIASKITEVSVGSPAGLHIFGIAIMGYLSQTEKAQQTLQALRSKNPNYDRDLTNAFLMWQPDDSLKEIVFEGWRLAGLDI